MFCAPETANPLLNWGKKTRLAPVVESLVSNVQTTIFLGKISEKLPLSETPKCHLFWLLCQICPSLAENEELRQRNEELQKRLDELVNQLDALKAEGEEDE